MLNGKSLGTIKGVSNIGISNGSLPGLKIKRTLVNEVKDLYKERDYSILEQDTHKQSEYNMNKVGELVSNALSTHAGNIVSVIRNFITTTFAGIKVSTNANIVGKSSTLQIIADGVRKAARSIGSIAEKTINESMDSFQF